MDAGLVIETVLLLILLGLSGLNGFFIGSIREMKRHKADLDRWNATLERWIDEQEAE